MIIYDNSNSILKSLLFHNHHKEHLVLLHVSASKLLASTNEDPYPQPGKQGGWGVSQTKEPAVLIQTWRVCVCYQFNLDQAMFYCSTCKPHSHLLINCFCRTSTSSARTLRTCAGQTPDRNCWSYSHHSSRQNCQVIGSDQFFFWTVDKPNHSKPDLITAASSGGLASFLIASWPFHLA